MYHDDYRQRPEAIISPPNTVGRWDPEDFAAIFSRLIRHGLKDGSLSPERAEDYGTKCGHYGRMALMDQEVQREGWAAVRVLTGEEE